MDRLTKLLMAVLAVGWLGVAVPAQAEILFEDGVTTVDEGPGPDNPLYSEGDFLLDNGSNANGSGRTVSGLDIAGGWEVFQPFTVPEPGWDVTTIGVDGWIVLDPMGLGMLGALMPDDNGTPDEGNILATNVYFLGNDPFNPNWRDEDINRVLQPGRYWMRWSDNGDEGFWSAVFNAPSGENSHSRRGDGQIFNSGPTALRIAGEIVPEPTSLALLAVGGLALIRRR